MYSSRIPAGKVCSYQSKQLPVADGMNGETVHSNLHRAKENQLMKAALPNKDYPVSAIELGETGARKT